MSFTITKEVFVKESVEEFGMFSNPIPRTISLTYTALSINYGGKFVGDTAEVYFSIEADEFSPGETTFKILTETTDGEKILQQAESELALLLGATLGS
ncbi:hypothetical protein MOA67_gp095 [Klebsiella phage KpLz-2_45]|uniref:hypothetical protein n=1 Tax=Klebsiella phage KpLz-2_45 TaxID=2698923 RepID=UPI001F136605|nr:hypothetical protein MOA67_gp095 [Klebsiella phage KpLz-2_45]UKS71961.1 hypothetical protein KpLz245_0950 [Klebsiella phage KpLz-2_45]